MEMKGNKTKKLKTLAGFGLSLLLTLFSACTTPTDSSTGSEDAPITVSLISNSAFTAQADTVTFQRGEDVQFTITMHEGFEFVGCNYDNFDFSIEGNVVYITLYDVLYPFRLQIQSKDIRIPEEELKRQYQINYHLNGGTTSDGNADFCVNSTLKNHDRANVSIGEGLERSGYTLYGWNTKADGSGEHIGLGSRVTIPESRVVELYAEWIAWTPNEAFEYEEGEKGLTLTKYLGDALVQDLVIPNEIGGKPVVQIAAGFAKDVSADELVLSQNLFSALLFRAQTVQDAGALLIKLFTDIGFSVEYFAASFEVLGITFVEVVFIALSIICMGFVCEFGDYKEDPALLLTNKTKERTLYAQKVSVYFYLILIIAFSWIMLLGMGDVSAFVYFQF